jgi:hypothetical protein
MLPSADRGRMTRRLLEKLLKVAKGAVEHETTASNGSPRSRLALPAIRLRPNSTLVNPYARERPQIAVVEPAARQREGSPGANHRRRPSPTQYIVHSSTPCRLRCNQRWPHRMAGCAVRCTNPDRAARQQTHEPTKQQDTGRQQAASDRIEEAESFTRTRGTEPRARHSLRAWRVHAYRVCPYLAPRTSRELAPLDLTF